MKILIAEDDHHIRHGLAEIMRKEGYDTVLAADGDQALELFHRERPDFVCLDVMMPGVNGYDVCREIRQARSTVPIIFISAKSEEIDKVLGLELGADDFIMKPFGVREVVARLRAVARRYRAAHDAPPEPEPFTMGDLEVFPAELRARRGEQVIDLGPRDVKILELLHSRQGSVVDRDTFFNVCWGFDHVPNSRSLDQHISQLRKRIEQDPASPRIVLTVHGAGYRYDG
jgi:two-component system, OmpR family, alkaline phosphatase synthesis response regulator PhoP